MNNYSTLSADEPNWNKQCNYAKIIDPLLNHFNLYGFLCHIILLMHSHSVL